MFDPFELLGLEKRYALDFKILEKRYFEEQKKTHPDCVKENERAEASKKSTRINQAFLLLKDPLQRAAFLLKAAGVAPLSHDPLFLGEVMIWNERLEVGEDIEPELLHEKDNLFNGLETAFEEKNYEMVRQALYRLTYVHKLLQETGEKKK
jgi:molecular chaperone HscB